nr:immunoglobulin heavy chain junction region [Mus musculus]NSM04160.1 immunoglobulin heavy chain junction region [Mus musculus]NSM04216.1 immunoglobulin heavy chain junction region [Mus musculus]NSM04228.1 immunoglobulin heavy chain junction region [Mus musculus]NSM04270.1 immunoglobulin heavy chain junction region [Mus musculus]
CARKDYYSNSNVMDYW